MDSCRLCNLLRGTREGSQGSLSLGSNTLQSPGVFPAANTSPSYRTATSTGPFATPHRNYWVLRQQLELFFPQGRDRIKQQTFKGENGPVPCLKPFLQLLSWCQGLAGPTSPTLGRNRKGSRRSEPPGRFHVGTSSPSEGMLKRLCHRLLHPRAAGLGMHRCCSWRKPWCERGCVCDRSLHFS